MQKEKIMKDVLVFDTETTGLPERGAKWDVDYQDFPHIVQLAWIMNGVEKSYIIKPDGYTIPDETVAIHGISQERAEKEGKPFEIVLPLFLEDCEKANMVGGHNVYFDTSIVKANILRKFGKGLFANKAEKALFKGKRFDTMRSTIKFVGATFADGRPGKFPNLGELYDKLFPGETFPAHDALEDVRATCRCLVPLVEMGLVSMEQKTYDEPQETKPKPRKKRNSFGVDLEFKDSPVTLPGDVKHKAPTSPAFVSKELVSEVDKMLNNTDF